MRIDNKGFTLVELLAVMVILISISLVAVSTVTESLARRDVKECEEQQELAVGAAKIYFSMNNVNNGSVMISQLKDAGYFKENNKIDRLNTNDTIKVYNGKYLYNDLEVGDSCS